jgi:hypothetical protein
MFPSAKRFANSLSFSAVLLLGAAVSTAQTFRGGINGTVTDVSGAVVAGAQVTATDIATGIVHTTVSSSAGDFSFNDLPLDQYTLTVSAEGFQTTKIEQIPVSAGSIYTAPVHLGVAGSSVNIDVAASALTLDTTTPTQTTVVGNKAVEAVPLNGRDFTQLIALTPGFAGYSAGGAGSLNGTRFDQINWQIDGIDNNDLWANIPAVNQGGVLGIAGIVLPIDAIDQFSVQTQAAPEAGRNPGGVVNVALRSGTNQIHGTAYYFNRNEAYAESSPFLPDGTKQPVNRNYNAGFSVGGPILHDKFFYFATFETQHFTIGQQGEATEPSALYQAAAQALLTKYNVATNPVSVNLLSTLWPSYSLTGPAQGENYLSPNPQVGHSYNGLIKLDYAINAKNNLSAHWFAGQGNQVAPEGSQLFYYYEVGPIHVQNYAIVLNSTLTNSTANQLLLGVNYFNQIFNDNKKNFDVLGTGFNIGSDYPTVAPHIRISGFDAVGIVAPSGRNDITGHITDTFSWTRGKHEFRFGGEYRQAQTDAFNSGNSTGQFKFTGSQGPWTSADNSDNNVLALADFLAGYVATSSLSTGDPKRQVFINTFALFGQDAWKLTPRLTINYGVRYDYEGPLHNSAKNLSIFLPSQGFVFQGAGINSLYPQNWKNVSPRVGFSFQPTANGSTVVRGSMGLYFDQPVTAAFLNNHTSNSSPIGVQANPVGTDTFFTESRSAYTIQSGQQIFPSGAQASCVVTPRIGAADPVVEPCGAFGIDPRFRTPYVIAYSFNVQQSLGSKMIAQLGYVGNESRKLLGTIDINQAAYSSAGSPSDADGAYAQQASRPFFSQYPTLGNINQLGTIATGNYNSLQATLRLANYHGITSQASYTWGHALDELSQSRSQLPQDSTNFKGDYGNTALDTRNTFTAYATYAFPSLGHGPKRLVEGWEANALVNLHGGQPFTVYNGEDTSGTDENVQRVNQVSNPFAGVSHKFDKTTQSEQWVNPNAFVEPANGTNGTIQRNSLFGPGYSDVDVSLFKTTPITERVHVQLRAEIYNVFNRYNFAPPNNTLGGGFGQLFDTIGDYSGAPGIGPGEPLNVQLGGKIIF